jgi:PAS domain S-box-containing protein/diguanylate cyclase (GGDEF)-like protein
MTVEWARRRFGRLFRNPVPEKLFLPVDAAAVALDHSGEGVMIADMRARGHPIVQVNAAFESITGYPAAEAIGKNCRYLQGNDRLQPEIDEIRAALVEGRPCAVTLRNYRRDGSMFRNALRLFPLRASNGVMTHSLGLIRDVTYAPGTDRLTDLLDRYGFLDALSSMEARRGRSVLMIKIDIARFHEINSGYGYDAGDALLRAVAERLAKLSAATVARVGADAFMLAFTIDDHRCTDEILAQLAAILAPRFILPGAAVAAQFATGYAVGDGNAGGRALIRQAGAALHRSKLSPMRPACAFDESDERAARNRVRLTTELHNAVTGQELLFHYQPQIDLATGAMVGAEALLRWDHGAFGMQPPSRFIGLAEQTGMILEIGAWGLRTVAACASEINRARRMPIRFSFNVSIVEFTLRDMVAFVRKVLKETDCRGEWLTLELTENLMADGSAEIRRAFQGLRDLGVGLSIDDFGTGYSNLRYLETFPISEIKIDRSLVHDVAHSAAKRVIVESVIKLGTALGIQIVAEGIETEAERAIMRAMGCPIGQGYFFAYPMDESAFRRLLKEGLMSPAQWDASRYLSLFKPSGDE